MRERLEKLSDTRLWLVLSAALFALAAWPLLLVRVPPLQDLPNHLASAYVLEHPAAFPDLVSNGWLKTNQTLYAWLVGVGRVTSLETAARLFVALTLAAMATGTLRLVLEIGGRRRMIVAALLAWPTLHNWFVSCGMLDFAFGAALALWGAVLLARLERAPTTALRASLALLGVAVWYTHVAALALLLLLAAGSLLGPGAGRARRAGRALLPLLPAVALAAWSVVVQLRAEGVAGSHGVEARAVWEVLYDVWAEYAWGFTVASATSLVVPLALAWFVVKGGIAEAPVLTRRVLLVLAVAYLVLPFEAGNWFCVNVRLLPLLYAAALLRVPESLPRWVAAALAACALAYSAGMGRDEVRLARELETFAAGTKAVAPGQRMLPLIFEPKGSSENTWPLEHAFGLYVERRGVQSPLLFAHSPSFALSRRSPGPPELGQMRLEGFARSMRTPAQACGPALHGEACEALYDARWAALWDVATPRFDAVLTWAATPEALARIPDAFVPVFEQGPLRIYEKR